jgi:glycosyltransferase 2 family protein
LDDSAADASPAGPPLAGAKRGRLRKRDVFATLAKLAVSGLAIFLVLRVVDFDNALERLQTQSVPMLFLALGAMVVQLFLGAWRWHSVRRGLGVDARYRNTLRLYVIGSFFSSYVISGVSGDIMRGWLSFKAGVDPARAANSVILDRVVILSGIAIMLLPAMPWFFLTFGTGIEGWAPAIAAGVLFAAVFATSQTRRLPESWQKTLPGRLARKLGDGMHDVFMRPASAARAIACAVLAQIALAVTTWALAISLHIPAGFLDCLIIIQIVAVVNAIPISIGGWGVREAAVVTLFGFIGVEAEAALLLSVELGLLGLIVNLPGGVVWLMSPAGERSRTPGGFGAPAA